MKASFLKFSGAYRALWICGWLHLCLVVIFVLLTVMDQRMLLGVNIWIKPLKFALSIGIYCLTWPFFLIHLEGERDEMLGRRFSRFTIFAMVFEMLAIASQAARGELSHFNQQGLYNMTLYGLMGIVITTQTLFSVFIGYSFFRSRPGGLSHAMLWAIRLGILIASIFALEGGLMGQRMSHTVGAVDGGQGIPLLNWSSSAGDLRIAHFFGLHALQLLPLFVWVFRVKRSAVVIGFGVLYFGLTSFVFYRALLGLSI
ncbi:hypothetical protein [Pedobacter deserti]|uniref:hypothetical protein n=1 Tax=Pedobacter deserti TaxID=2817382 RepID=UPI00210CE03C|nr:hypothetical protein [Pedobacter sp. SYSU D00382]